eukprot:scaffold4296_cov136-Isochrysis_galbana.AAC.1
MYRLGGNSEQRCAECWLAVRSASAHSLPPGAPRASLGAAPAFPSPSPRGCTPLWWLFLPLLRQTFFPSCSPLLASQQRRRPQPGAL